MVKYVDSDPQDYSNVSLSGSGKSEKKVKRAKRSLNSIQRKIVAWGVPTILALFAMGTAWPTHTRYGSTSFGAVFGLLSLVGLISLFLNLYLWRSRKQQ